MIEDQEKRLVTTSLKALIVVTSHDKMGGTGKETGFYYEEMAVPYWALMDAGLDVRIASMKGGLPPHDPESLHVAGKSKASVDRFLACPSAVAKLQDTQKLESVDPRDFALVFLAGGHGTMWDFAQSEMLGRLVGQAYDSGAIIGAICHGVAGLLGARRYDGRPLVEGMRINSFTNAEEEAAGLTGVVPYLVESRLRELGAKFESAPNFQPKVVRDGRIITGQNPQSAELVASELIAALRLR